MGKGMKYEEIKKLDRNGILKERMSAESRELRVFIDNDAKLYTQVSKTHIRMIYQVLRAVLQLALQDLI